MFTLLSSFAFLLYQLSPINAITWELGDYTLPQPTEDGVIFSLEDTKAYFFGGHNRNTNFNTIYKLDTTTSTPSWQLLPVTMPVTNIRTQDAVKLGTTIYFYTSGTFLVFDTISETFLDNQFIVNNPYYGSSSSISDDKNYIYVIGGQGTSSRYVVRYDIKNNQWNVLSNNSPLPWFWLNTLYYPPKNRIYVFGGYSSGHFNTIYYFDLNTNTWSNPMATMTLTGTSSESVYIPEIDTIYIIETYWSVATKVNSYNPVSNTITTETPRSYLDCTSGTAATTLNNRLQLFGGYWNGQTDQDKNCRTEELYSYTPAKQEITWELGDYPLPKTIRSGVSFSFGDNIVYFFGGYDQYINGNGLVRSNTIYKLDTTVSGASWQQLSETMPNIMDMRPLYVAKVGKMIYFFDSYYTGKFYLFDTATETFLDNTNIAVNPYWKYGDFGSSVSTNDANYIYLTGGYGEMSGKVVRYDISNNRWDLLSSNAPLQWYYINTIYYAPQNRIYVFGGYSPSSSHFKDIYYFDLNTNTWSNKIDTMAFTGILSLADIVYVPAIDTIFIIQLNGVNVGSYNPVSNVFTIETPRTSVYSSCGIDSAVTTLGNRIQLFGGDGYLRLQNGNCRTQKSW